MPTYYCALWIPTKHHIKQDPIITILPEIDISDNPDDIHFEKKKYENIIRKKYKKRVKSRVSNKINKCIASFSLNEENGDIFISLRHKETAEETKVFKLTRENFSDNGIMIYTYSVDDDNQFEAILGVKMHPSIYHNIKRFYHSHEYHPEEQDSLLEPFVRPYNGPDSIPPIKENDNEVLVHYLLEYEKKFRALSCSLSTEFNLWKKRVETCSFNPKDIKEKYQHFENKCHTQLGQALYYNCLVNSRYNTLFKPFSPSVHLPSLTEKCRGYYKKAINTKNYIEEIKLIRKKNEGLYLRFIENQTRKEAAIGAFTGVVFTLLVGAIPYFLNKEDTKAGVSNQHQLSKPPLSGDLNSSIANRDSLNGVNYYFNIIPPDSLPKGNLTPTATAEGLPSSVSH